MTTDLHTTPVLDHAGVDQRVRDLLRGTEFRATMLDAQRTLFKPRVITTQQELTALTQTATDGDEVYVLADSANGVMWRFRYNAASTSAYRWEAVGGPPLYDFVATSEATASGSYVNLATVGPQVAIPLAGDYMVAVGFTGTAVNLFALMAYDIGGDADAARMFNATANATEGSPTMVRRKNALVAGTTLVTKYRTSGTTATFFNRWLSVQPVRVG